MTSVCKSCCYYCISKDKYGYLSYECTIKNDDNCSRKYECVYCGQLTMRRKGCDCMGKGTTYSLANADSVPPMYVGPDRRIYVEDPNGIYYGGDYIIIGTLSQFIDSEAKVNRVKVKGGMKFDDGKLRWDLLPYDAIEKIVDILTYGANKYAPNNWQQVKSERYEAAMMRHFVAYKKGERNDRESGKMHLAHMFCNAMFLLWQEMQRPVASLPQCVDSDKKYAEVRL